MNRHVESQLSVEVANAPRALARISDLLAQSNIAINATSIADGDKRGYIRLLSDDVEEAQRILRANGFTVESERVISVRLDDQKGKLANITQALAHAHINIDYFYASVDRGDQSTQLIMKVENIPLVTRLIDEIVEESMALHALQPA